MWLNGNLYLIIIRSLSLAEALRLKMVLRGIERGNPRAVECAQDHEREVYEFAEFLLKYPECRKALDERIVELQAERRGSNVT